jgi:hypothetical protein
MAKRGFTPHQWYWVAEDGRVYSSTLQKVVDKSDPGFRNFVAAGGHPTPWPRHRQGPQDDAALHEVISKHGLSLTPHEALGMYVRTKHAAISAGGTVVNVNPPGQKPLLIDVDTSTRGLATLHADAMHASDNAHETFHVHQSKGLSVELNADQIKTAHKAATAFVRHASRSLSSVLTAIAEKKITTKEQVDNPPTNIARWPVNV